MCLKCALIVENNVDPDQTALGAFDLGLHCLLNFILSNIKGKKLYDRQVSKAWLIWKFLLQVILTCSALPCLLHLLSSSKESIRKEACWTISNITAGNRMQIQVGYWS